MTSTYTLLGLQAETTRCPPGLYIVATPIGNLKDITLRALETLAAADAILAEDKRVTKVLLAHYGISTPILSYHEHNAELMRPDILARLAGGAALALVSDAGTPLVSDPGYKLVQAAVEAGHAVTALPGASAVLAALVLAGLPSDRFFFEGFLPPRSAERRRRARQIAGIDATIVLFEAPHRLDESLADLAAILGNRPAAVARELTKKFETIRRGTLDELAAHYAHSEKPRGEIVILIAPASGGESAPGDDVVDARLRSALAEHSPRDAVALVAADLGLPRRAVYARALLLQGRNGDGQ
ncbi:MAG TPA: 16S rRNA (cytidine(1402)-2'-O)-methyltransferase [Beijerinckiaceae bacterium]|nr:16S rRNA (cytidine(1402)-2'-O)-methyltransferase [Beijerinckiaceae bacterium]